ncbi:MAG: glycosyltransferase [Dehalococcoidia bacterium]
MAVVTNMTVEDAVKQDGVERIPRGEEDGPSFQVGTWAQPIPVAIQVKHIEYALARFQPDVLIGQPLTLSVHIVRERHKVPAAVIGLATYLWPSSATLTPETARSRREHDLIWRYGDMLQHYNEARALFRLPPCDAPPERNPFLGDLFLLQSVPELAIEAADLPGQVHFVGSCLWEPQAVDAGLADWLTEGGEATLPLLYVQPSRNFQSPRFWSNFIAALAERPVRVAASVGRLDGAVGEMPAGSWVRPFVSQAQVLPRAQAVVASGTTTALLGALTHGLPSLLLPAGGEQLEVAAHCEHAGVGVSLPPDADAPTIAEYVERILADTALQESARHLQRAFAHIDGPGTAAKLLEQLAVDRRPVMHVVPELPASVSRI